MVKYWKILCMTEEATWAADSFTWQKKWSFSEYGQALIDASCAAASKWTSSFVCTGKGGLWGPLHDPLVPAVLSLQQNVHHIDIWYGWTLWQIKNGNFKPITKIRFKIISFFIPISKIQQPNPVIDERVCILREKPTLGEGPYNWIPQMFKIVRKMSRKTETLEWAYLGNVPFYKLKKPHFLLPNFL